jgi:carotenoid cleavage dioxygenase-like enzyme
LKICINWGAMGILVIAGELFTYGYDISKPHVYYHVVSKEGVMSEATVITLPKGVMMHDFSITENYAIFLDLPLVLQPEVSYQQNIDITIQSFSSFNCIV